MLKHGDIWSAIDSLARDHGLTASGLARRAGLDPTTFNKSKRVTREGKQRWPSTESVAKILDATGTTVGEFVSFINGDSLPVGARTIPLIGYAQAGENGFFTDTGYPVTGTWDEIPLPEVSDPHAYALEITGDSMEPVYRDGDYIVVSPAANVRRGDRVVVRSVSGEIMAKQLLRLTARRIEFISFNTRHPDRSFAVEDVAWMHRIIWVSQ
jgi:phage repressor protein C with HTH and peptisase S24 domain